jgi:hypothetical protein
VSLDSSRFAPQAHDSSFGASRPRLEYSLRSGPRAGLYGHDHVDGVARAGSKGGESSGLIGVGCAGSGMQWHGYGPGGGRQCPTGIKATMPPPTRAHRHSGTAGDAMAFALKRSQPQAGPVR